MRIKTLLLAALILAFSSMGYAQSKTKEVAPHIIVKNLYAAQKAGSGPFFQTKNRAVVDKYFTKNLADLIWKDAITANGEVGAIDFDPLYGSQDPQITDFTIMETGWGGDSKFGPEDEAVVQVTFKDSGKERMVSFQFKQGRDKNWKIYDIHYRGDGEEVKLLEVLTKASARSKTGSDIRARKSAHARSSSGIETVGQLAKAISEAFTAKSLGELDAEPPYLGSVRIVVKVLTLTASQEEKVSYTNKTFKTLAQAEKWLSRGPDGGPSRYSGPLEGCSRGVCTYQESGGLHNTLFLQKVTYVLKGARPYIKTIYVTSSW